MAWRRAGWGGGRGVGRGTLEKGGPRRRMEARRAARRRRAGRESGRGEASCARGRRDRGQERPYRLPSARIAGKMLSSSAQPRAALVAAPLAGTRHGPLLARGAALTTRALGARLAHPLSSRPSLASPLGRPAVGVRPGRWAGPSGGARARRLVPRAMMFERFTEKAVKVIMLAQEESKRMGHNFLGTEQLLLGLIEESTGAWPPSPAFSVAIVHGAPLRRAARFWFSRKRLSGPRGGGAIPGWTLHALPAATRCVEVVGAVVDGWRWSRGAEEVGMRQEERRRLGEVGGGGGGGRVEWRGGSVLGESWEAREGCACGRCDREREGRRAGCASRQRPLPRAAAIPGARAARACTCADEGHADASPAARRTAGRHGRRIWTTRALNARAARADREDRRRTGVLGGAVGGESGQRGDKREGSRTGELWGRGLGRSSRVQRDRKGSREAGERDRRKRLRKRHRKQRLPRARTHTRTHARTLE